MPKYLSEVTKLIPKALVNMIQNIFKSEGSITRNRNQLKLISDLSLNFSKFADDEPVRNNSTIWQIFQLNSPEWKYNVIGSISAIGFGCAITMSAVLFGQLTHVRNHKFT